MMRQCGLLKRGPERINSKKGKKKGGKEEKSLRPPSSVPSGVPQSAQRSIEGNRPAGATSAMGDDKSPRSLSPLGGRDRDRELLIPVSDGSAPGDGDEDGDRTASSSASAALSSSGREVRWLPGVPAPDSLRSIP
jgi:hypothetical protein